MKPIWITIITIITASEVNTLESASNVILKLGITASIVLSVIYLALQIVNWFSEDSRADNHVMVKVVDLLESAVGSLKDVVQQGVTIAEANKAEIIKATVATKALEAVTKAYDAKITDLEGSSIDLHKYMEEHDRWAKQDRELSLDYSKKTFEIVEEIRDKVNQLIELQNAVK